LHVGAGMNRNAEIPSSDAALGGQPTTVFRTPTLMTIRPLRRVCAWCKRIAENGMEWEDDRPAASAEPGVTHGICPRCAADINSL